ncbi:deoxyribose-phosphate aldolase [Parabacteroides sp. PF5-5]|uniref:deoxyribose-phosphate aldolase n=1 Tax=unclassified Parabacteroides TaxID=2649774 RepID=UPI0024759F1F|nr:MULTISPECIES: deoxyribose-phosphate aldolase [unclassified Parabacteroides]MDH6305983.1 deoxyribose-phosphate aldolase [Parabacteroides sp. PH5-39]MDH6317239.1 deoxyribose-phosphate aldolase [Parabacteroides sp. PF5-13]MDH6320695.1 deoxyribose-phosphate aldolase [Parabacteroides sp. PH5-13]MDH6324384.1 deoxyribose-phosphate aldolase [Parabacteroides sp. PH5-8]MDH6328424.1 deoxyribose-phosphate aldolase [Parabacteroides sp. PH5-41]
MDKYQEAFAKFQAVGSSKEITEKVNKILQTHYDKNFTADVLKKLHGCIDLTSLSTTDTKESIWQFVNQVNDFEGTAPDIPNVAAICTYPNFVETVKQALTTQNVKIAAVAGAFPSSQTFIEVKIAEVALAVMHGAEEVDTVINVGYLLEKNYQELAEEIQEIKSSCQEATLKVILETGALNTPDDIQRAAILAIYSGADILKTSTGKEYTGATPESVYIMCQVIKQYYDLTGTQIGIKVSGGVRKAEDAVKYYTIVKEILGEEWLNKDYFRIGASQLRTDLLKRISE